MSGARLVIAGTHSGVGKTTVTLAILAALRARGRRVQPFKAGPDFIDPGHHTAAAGRPSRNLDGWLLGEALNREIFLRAAIDADLSIIEGVMGLFDGASAVSDIGSTAELAKQLAAPVLLVLDGSAMARSAAAMVQGYAQFDPDLRVAGVLFNRVKSQGHYRLLQEAVEAAAEVKVVGYLRPDPALTIPERHLGLTTAVEGGSQEHSERLGLALAETVDLDLVEELAKSAVEEVKGEGVGVRGTEPFSAAASLCIPHPSPCTPHRVRVGVAYDPAFCFYYPENLELLEAQGAELIRFSPMHDERLPEADLVYLGGGYPELHAETLAANAAMRRAIRDYAEQGGAIYAECGGLMYLTEAIRDFDGRAYEMVGVFPAQAVMRRSGLTIGYRRCTVARRCLLGESGLEIRGHEFHHSCLEPTGPLEYACTLTDARGCERRPDGLINGHVVALYTHLHFASQPELPRALIAAARARAALRAP
ncbi:MAG: cobyrinate a,c-diamide synthase [Nitrospirota bacterium]